MAVFWFQGCQVTRTLLAVRGLSMFLCVCVCVCVTLGVCVCMCVCVCDMQQLHQHIKGCILVCCCTTGTTLGWMLAGVEDGQLARAVGSRAHAGC